MDGDTLHTSYSQLTILISFKQPYTREGRAFQGLKILVLEKRLEFGASESGVPPALWRVLLRGSASVRASSR